MPRSIQMGTGPLKHTVITSPTVNGSFYSGAPDLLSGVSQSHSSDTSCASMDTVTTPASSDCSADVNDIIKDLSKTENREPLIGQKSEKKKSVRNNVARSQTLPCFSQNDKNQTINHQYEQHFEDNELPLRQTMYPSTSTVPWSRDNPYLHTSGHPYIISRQRPVRPDEQYPVPYDQPSLQYQYSYYPDYQPMFSSLNNYFYPSDHPGYNGAVMYPMNIDQHPNEIASAFHVPNNTRIIEKEITKVSDQKPVNQNGNPQQSSEDKTLSDGEIIKEDDSTKDILSKLQGEGVGKVSEYESDKESEGISEELESAFQNLSMTNNSWDEGTQI